MRLFSFTVFLLGILFLCNFELLHSNFLNYCPVDDSPLESSFEDVHVSRWRPLFAPQVGVSLITNAGKPQIFPIVTNADQFYIYQPSAKHILPALYGTFLGVEWNGDTNWSFQLLADYNQTSTFSVNGSLAQGIDQQTISFYDYAYQVKLRQLLAEVKIEYSFCQKADAYLLFGIGGSMNSAFNFATTVPFTIASNRLYEDALSTSCSYLLGCGVDLLILDQVRFGLSYRFANFRKLSLGKAFINDNSVVGTLWQNCLYANQFVVQLQIVF